MATDDARAVLEHFRELAKRMAERTHGRPADDAASGAWALASLWTTAMVAQLEERLLARDLRELGARLSAGSPVAYLPGCFYSFEPQWLLGLSAHHAWHDVGREQQAREDAEATELGDD